MFHRLICQQIKIVTKHVGPETRRCSRIITSTGEMVLYRYPQLPRWYRQVPNGQVTLVRSNLRVNEFPWVSNIAIADPAHEWCGTIIERTPSLRFNATFVQNVTHNANDPHGLNMLNVFDEWVLLRYGLHGLTPGGCNWAPYTAAASTTHLKRRPEDTRSDTSMYI